jgi:ABC-type multidrug transport system fused ATPase/permease subunit
MRPFFIIMLVLIFLWAMYMFFTSVFGLFGVILFISMVVFMVIGWVREDIKIMRREDEEAKARAEAEQQLINTHKLSDDQWEQLKKEWQKKQ